MSTPDRYKLFYETVMKGGLSSADDLLRSTMDTAIEVADADRGFLFLSRDGRETCPVARSRARTDIESPTEEMSRSILDNAFGASSTLVHHGVTAEGGLPVSESAANLGVRAFIAIPLRGGKGQTVGIGYLDRLRSESRPPFTSEQQKSVRAFFEDMAELLAAVETHRATVEEAARLRETVEVSRLFPEIIGRDPSLLSVLCDAHSVAASDDASVLVLGATGTGKELIAHAIHRLSSRADRPYLTFNCAAVTRELADSELFGHTRGAFTGAAGNRKGLFQEAHSGTLFLDEIGDMPLEVQPRLLRVLENGEIRRVGESRPRQVDVRVLAATARDLGKLVEEGRFRRDLLFRLSVITLRIPALRVRPDDIELLARHFLDEANQKRRSRITGFSKDALEALAAHAWPGNVRELKNVVARATLLASSSHIAPEDLRLGEEPLPEAAATGANGRTLELEEDGTFLTLEEVERRYFATLLEATAQNRSEVARHAGLPRTSALARLRKLGLLRADGGPSE